MTDPSGNRSEREATDVFSSSDEAVRFFGLFRKYKKEQGDELKAQRDEIEAERLANEKVLEELKALKAQLDAQKNEEASTQNEDTQKEKDSEDPILQTQTDDPAAESAAE